MPNLADAYAEAHLDDSGLPRELAQFEGRLLRAMEGVERHLRLAPTLDDTRFIGDLTELQARVRQIPPITIPVDADTTPLDRDLRTHRTPEVTAPVDGDTEPLDDKVRRHRTPRVTAPVDGDADPLLADIERIRRTMRPVKVGVELDRSQLAAATAALSRLGITDGGIRAVGNTIRLDVDVDQNRLSDVTRLVAGLGGTVSGMNSRGDLTALSASLRNVGGAASDAGPPLNDVSRLMPLIGQGAGLAAAGGLPAMAAALGLILVTAQGLIAAGVVKLFADAAGAASDLGETLNAVEQTFGENARDILGFAEAANATLGLSDRAARQAATGFGLTFTQMGFTSDAASTLSTDLTTLSSDLSSFFNREQQDVAEALTGALVGEREAIKSLLGPITEAQVGQLALQLGLAETTAELSQQDKAMATYVIALQRARPALGDFGRTLEESLPNQMRRLSSEWEDTLAVIGQPIVPEVAGFAGVVTETLLPAVREVGQELGPNVAGFIREATDSLREVGPGIIDTLGETGGILIDIGRENLPTILRGAELFTTYLRNWAAGAQLALRLLTNMAEQADRFVSFATLGQIDLLGDDQALKMSTLTDEVLAFRDVLEGVKDSDLQGSLSAILATDEAERSLDDLIELLGLLPPEVRTVLNEAGVDVQTFIRDGFTVPDDLLAELPTEVRTQIRSAGAVARAELTQFRTLIQNSIETEGGRALFADIIGDNAGDLNAQITALLPHLDELGLTIGDVGAAAGLTTDEIVAMFPGLQIVADQTGRTVDELLSLTATELEAAEAAAELSGAAEDLSASLDPLTFSDIDSNMRAWIETARGDGIVTAEELGFVMEGLGTDIEGAGEAFDLVDQAAERFVSGAVPTLIEQVGSLRQQADDTVVSFEQLAERIAGQRFVAALFEGQIDQLRGAGVDQAIVDFILGLAESGDIAQASAFAGEIIGGRVPDFAVAGILLGQADLERSMRDTFTGAGTAAAAAADKAGADAGEAFNKASKAAFTRGAASESAAAGTSEGQAFSASFSAAASEGLDRVAAQAVTSAEAAGAGWGKAFLAAAVAGVAQVPLRVRAMSGLLGPAGVFGGERWAAGFGTAAANDITGVTRSQIEQAMRALEVGARTSGSRAGLLWGAGFAETAPLGVPIGVLSAMAQITAGTAGVRDIGLRVGIDFGAGMAEGIARTAGLVALQAAALVAAAEKGARDKALSKSPSELFARIGRDLAAGMAVGISDPSATSAATTSAADLVAAMQRSAIGAVDPGLIAGLTAIATPPTIPAIPATSTVSGGFTAHITIDARGGGVDTAAVTEAAFVGVDRAARARGQALSRRHSQVDVRTR